MLQNRAVQLANLKNVETNVCILKCCASFEFVGNFLPHTMHLKGLGVGAGRDPSILGLKRFFFHLKNGACYLELAQNGLLTEGEGSVQLTFSLR
jgi:hypothetical protein